ncbi:MAG: four helix bundle protein, partial [Bacteroidetes bacterium]|nr:four helix bundle protein [Bacteroidota bacterium]
MDIELLNRNKNINRGFRELIVWQESSELYKIVKNKIRSLKNVPFKVCAQVEDSMFSVSSNIAEGYCRRSIKENIQFINIAIASLGENYSQILNDLNQNEHIIGVSPILFGQAMIRSNHSFSGVMVRGIDPDNGFSLIKGFGPEQLTKALGKDAITNNLPGIILG